MLADEKEIQIIFLQIGTNKAGDMCWLGFKNSQGLKSWSNGLFSFTMRGVEKLRLCFGYKFDVLNYQIQLQKTLWNVGLLESEGEWDRLGLRTIPQAEQGREEETS
jgi:hypothetical protein